MNLEHWQQLEALYRAARERGPEERAALMAGIDPELRREVEVLLAKEGASSERPPARRPDEAIADSTVTMVNVGSHLGPYVIEAPLGSGGMGQVFRARDTRLGRDVAIKFSDQQFSERFAREVWAISALNHPNICTLYDVGPNYLVMELVDGETLRDWLKRAPAMARRVEIARQVLEALRAAHRAGIVHRDLKPANIMVRSDGYVKVLDFGLAKRMPAPGVLQTEDTETNLSLPGQILGTVAYMSPEQIQGQEIDQRSDLFAFGIILYEMLTGEHPWHRRSVVDTLHAILHDAPPAMDAASELGAEVAPIVKKLLSKTPAERYPFAEAVLEALASHRISSSAATAAKGKPPTSIAVLPFANMSADKENEYFSDGLAEEIINVLAHVPGMKVTARTSSFFFRGKAVEFGEIGRRLNVEHILEGSVRKAGNRIRVTAQLIKVTDGFHLWSERYDREMADIFAIQDEIAAAIAEALQVKLSVAPTALRRYTPNLPAYEAYLKARHHWAKVTPESLTRSREYYEQAIALDPGFALAHIGLADYFLLLTASAVLVPAHEAMPLVRACARKALELDPLLPDAHAMLGVVAAVYDYDWKDAERLFRLAMARDPVPPQVHQWYGYFYLLPMGRTEDAVEELERALKEDPLNLMFRMVLANCLSTAGRYEDASTELRRILELDENFWQAYLLLALNHVLRGMLTEALPIAEKGYSMAPWNSWAIAVFAAVLRRTGDTRRAEEVLQNLRNAPEAYGAPRGLSFFHFLCGEIDQAADWTEKSLEQRDPVSPIWLAVFRSSAHWPALAKMMNQPGRVS